MYTIARSIRVARGSWTALIAVPFVFAACGGERADARPVSAAGTGTQPADAKVTITAVPALKPPTGPAEATTTDVGQPATYANANDVFKAGHYPEAAEMFERYVASKPNDAFGLYMLGLSSWKAGDFGRAEEAFEKSIDINPTFAKAYFNSARVLLDLKRGPEALEQVEKGLEIDSTSADGWRLKARAQSASGDLDGAKETYRQLLVRDGEDLWGLNNLGVLLLDSGDFPDALGPLARAVQLKPTAPLFQNNFGMALERSGHPVAALHAYESAVRDDSTFTKAVKNLERMRGTVTDTTLNDEVSPQDLAEQFRQRIKMWKDSGTTRPDSSVAKHDTTAGVVPTTGDPIKIRPDSGK
jgi:tetratricopeptide (TPR) repeat protein